MLWLMVGGIFFGAVQDFTALYASVKNEGKSMGMLIEQYIGQNRQKNVPFVLVAVYPACNWPLLRILLPAPLTALRQTAALQP